jgi:hypothetical protein
MLRMRSVGGIIIRLLLLLHTGLPLVSTDLCFCSSAKGVLLQLSLSAEKQRKRTGVRSCGGGCPVEKVPIVVSEFDAPNDFDFSGYDAPKEAKHAEKGRKLRDSSAVRNNGATSQLHRTALIFAQSVRAGGSLANIQQKAAVQDRDRSVEACGDHIKLLVNESSVVECAGFIRLYSAFSHAYAAYDDLNGGTRFSSIRCKQIQVNLHPSPCCLCRGTNVGQNQGYEFAKMSSRLRLRGGGHNVYRNRDDRQAPQCSSWQRPSACLTAPQDRVFEVMVAAGWTRG